jgi:hypothetical protein
MRRAFAALIALVLGAACSRAAYENSQTGVVRSMLQLAGSRESDPSALDRETLHVDTVPLPSARAWPELVRAWATLRLPVTGADTVRYRVGGSAQPLGLIGGSKPSAWIDCGHGMAEAYADQYQVTFSMATRVMPLDSTRSTIESIIRASARPRDVSTEPFRCSSLGTLEIRIAEMIRQRAGTRR